MSADVRSQIGLLKDLSFLTVAEDKSFFFKLIFISLFFGALKLFPKFSGFPRNNLFCHLPDFPDWPVRTARLAVGTGQCGNSRR